jgi:hypothetical protein
MVSSARLVSREMSSPVVVHDKAVVDAPTPREPVVVDPAIYG